jgi:hypothetical protein
LTVERDSIKGTGRPNEQLDDLCSDMRIQESHGSERLPKLGAPAPEPEAPALAGMN